MPFARPTLDTLRTRSRSDFASRFPGADALLPTSNLRISADVLAGMMHGQYGYLDWIASQAIPDTAETEALERWAAVFGLARKAGTKSSGSATFTGTAGTNVPAGTVLQRADGIQYTVDTGGALSGSGTAFAITSTTTGGNTAAASGVKLTLASAIAGVTGTATVTASGLGGGADDESDDLLRARLLYRIQNPPQGGAAADYTAWALSVSGVTRVWVKSATPAPGSVTVYFTMDGIRTNGIPNTGDVATVDAYLESVRPVTANVVTVAPTTQAIPVTIRGLSPATSTVKAAVEAELTDMLLTNGEPGGTIRLSWFWEAVSRATGESYHVVQTPSADVVLTAGALPILGTVTYV